MKKFCLKKLKKHFNSTIFYQLWHIQQNWLKQVRKITENVNNKNKKSENYSQKFKPW